MTILRQDIHEATLDECQKVIEVVNRYDPVISAIDKLPADAVLRRVAPASPSEWVLRFRRR